MGFVEVRILDTNLRHLPNAFTYATEEQLDPGTSVRVAFNGRLRNGVVVRESEPFEGARPIKQVRGPGLPSWMIEFADELAASTLTDIGAVLAAMMPTRVASEEPKVPTVPLPISDVEPGAPSQAIQAALSPPGRVLYAPGLATDVASSIAKLIHDDLSAGGSVMVILPEVDRASEMATALLEVAGESAAWLGSDASDRMRYRAWLRLRYGVARMAIGGRGTVFAPFRPDLIVVMDEASAAHKEGRAPRFHSRSVAQMLADKHGARLVLVGSPPSIEARLDADPRRGRLTLVQSPAGIRSPVVVLEPAGLVPAPVTMRMLDESPDRLCVMVHRGDQVAQAAERLGRQLNRSVTILDASSDEASFAHARSIEGAQIVVGTPTLATDRPLLGVSVLAILGADAALVSAGFRAAEEVVAGWWRVINATRPKRILVESRDRNHHAIQALAKLDHDLFARKEAEARHAVGYPPYRALVRISTSADHMPRLIHELEGRSILGPMPDQSDESLQVLAVRGDRRLVADLAPIVAAWRLDGLRLKIDVDPWDLVEERWRS